MSARVERLVEYSFAASCAQLSVALRVAIAQTCDDPPWVATMPCALFPDFVGNVVGCVLMGSLCSQATALARLRGPSCGDDDASGASKSRVAVYPYEDAARVFELLRWSMPSVITSFSQWMLYVGRRFRHGHAVDALHTVLVPWTAFVFAYGAGCEIAALVVAHRRAQFFLRTIGAPLVALAIPLCVVGFWCTVLGASLSLRAGDGTLSHWAGALLLAPIGSLCRRSVQIALNRPRRFPYGTLVCNVVGCAIEAVIETRVSDDGLRQSLAQGFCASLSTVSSVVEESVVGLPTVDPTYVHNRVVYLVCSVGLCASLVAALL